MYYLSFQCTRFKTTYPAIIILCGIVHLHLLYFCRESDDADVPRAHVLPPLSSATDGKDNRKKDKKKKRKHKKPRKDDENASNERYHSINEQQMNIPAQGKVVRNISESDNDDFGQKSDTLTTEL